MEIAQQNGSVWWRPCQFTHKNPVQGKRSSHWFQERAPRDDGIQPKRGTSCSPLEIFCGRVRGAEKKAGGSERGNEIETRTEEVFLTASAMLHSPSLAFSFLRKCGRNTKTKPLSTLFMQCIGNSSNGNFSGSFTFPEFNRLPFFYGSDLINICLKKMEQILSVIADLHLHNCIMTTILGR